MKWLVRIVAALLGLVVLVVVVLFALSRRPGAGAYEVTLEIAQPPGAVWPWITEPEKLKQWVDWLAAVESDSTSPAGVGHREVWVMNDPNAQQPMRMPVTVTASDSARLAAAHIDMPRAFVGDVSFRLEDLGDGRTRLTQSSKFRYTNALFVLLEPLVTPEARKKEAADLARLKGILESAPRPAATP